MPVPTQTLDQIFSPTTPAVSPTTMATAYSQPKQSLDEIFGKASPQASKPSLDSIFNPPPAPPPGPGEGPETGLGGNNPKLLDKAGRFFGGIGEEAGKTVADMEQSSGEDIANRFSDAASGKGTPTSQLLSGFNIVGKDVLGPVLGTFGKVLDLVSGGTLNKALSGTVNALDATNPNNPLASLAGTNTPEGVAFLNKLNDFFDKNPEVKTALLESIPNMLNAGAMGAGGVEGDLNKAGSLKDAIKNTTEGVKSDLSTLGNITKEKVITPVMDKVVNPTMEKASSAASAIKEAIKPTLTPEEATGQIIQGKTEDVPAALRTLQSIDTTGVKTTADLQAKINSEIKPLAEQVDTELSKDPTSRPISTFEKTVGEGGNATKINYVQEAINNLKELYTKTSDAKGLAEIKAIETKVDGLRGADGKIIKNASGLTNKEVNDLSRKYGSEFGSKAFAKVSGDPLTSVNAQKFENIRMGLKDTARQGLGGAEAKALDAKLSDLYDTKKLIDKQVERVNTQSQKTSKQGIIPKMVGKGVKILDTVTGGPIKAIGKVMGAQGSSGVMDALELEGNLSKNLGIIKETAPKVIGKGSFGDIVTGPKGSNAVDFLLRNKGGEIPGAMNRTGLGDIDFVYGRGGEDGYGLAHIEEKHPEMIPHIEDIIKNGEIIKQANDRIIILKDVSKGKGVAAIRLDWNGAKKQWLVSSF